MSLSRRRIKTSDPKHAYQLVARYCAFRERSFQEARRILNEYSELSEEENEQVLAMLIEEGFINEQRFAESFVRGKFQSRNWGRIKIREGMKQKGLSDEEINAALLASLDAEKYEETLRVELTKKLASIPTQTNPAERYRKLLHFALRKGYESDLIRKILPELTKFNQASESDD